MLGFFCIGFKTLSAALSRNLTKYDSLFPDLGGLTF
jgi:hypothetical protein